MAEVETTATPPRVTFLRGLWDDVPLLNYAFYAVMIAYAEMVNLDPRRDDLFFSCLFPLAVPVVLYALRWRHANVMQKRVALTVLIGSVVALALIYFVAGPHPLEIARLRLIYEVSAVLNSVILMVHAWKRCRAWLALFLGPAAIYGVALENGGIILGYFEELEYTFYLGPLPAPIATMSGWITVFYLVTWVTWELRKEIPPLSRSIVGSAAVAMVAALLLDLQIDPIATAVGFWTWNHQLPDSGIMGVPVLNFVAWACAVLPFGLFLFWRQTRLNLSPEQVAEAEHRNWLWPRIPLILLVAALFFWTTMTVLELGFDGPTWRILHATFIEWGWMQPDIVWTPGD